MNLRIEISNISTKHINNYYCFKSKWYNLNLVVDNFNWILVITILAGLVIAYLLGRLHPKRDPDNIPQDFIDLYRQVEGLPLKVLQTIQGSINPQKGKMAELLTYAELRYDYDRIVPLGWPIDFIGIKNGDRIDFIEVKSGQTHLLTDEELHIKKLITAGRVNFRLIKISEDEIQRFVSARKDR